MPLPLSPSLVERHIDLVPSRPDDAPFLCLLYAAGRAAELALTGWSAEQKRTFCAMQFAARERHYAQVFDSAVSCILRRDAIPVGRLYADFNAAEALHLIDIALIPEVQGQGLGTLILTWLIEQARAGDRPLALQVAFDNPARRLYDRLGFVVTQEGFPYSSMLCR